MSEEPDKLVEDYDKGVQDGSIPPTRPRQLDPLLADVNDAVQRLRGGLTPRAREALSPCRTRVSTQRPTV